MGNYIPFDRKAAQDRIARSQRRQDKQTAKEEERAVQRARIDEELRAAREQATNTSTKKSHKQQERSPAERLEACMTAFDTLCDHVMDVVAKEAELVRSGYYPKYKNWPHNGRRAVTVGLARMNGSSMRRSATTKALMVRFFRCIDDSDTGTAPSSVIMTIDGILRAHDLAIRLLARQVLKDGSPQLRQDVFSFWLHLLTNRRAERRQQWAKNEL